MDGGMAMEGDGPASGDARWLGYLFASTDGVAMDASAASILGKRKRMIWTTEIASRRGLGQADLSQIERMGKAFESGPISDFRMPSNAYLNFIPSFLARAVGSYLWIRPAIDHDTCTMCQECVINCPEKVIYEAEGKLKFDYDRCIKCMCCHELCPHRSVFLERSRLAKLTGQ